MYDEEEEAIEWIILKFLDAAVFGRLWVWLLCDKVSFSTIPRDEGSKNPNKETRNYHHDKSSS
jgi:hypothetical protein